MITQDPNWARWIKASCAPFFKERIKNLQFLIEEAGVQKQPDHAEFRINGPFITQYPSECFYIDIEINVLITTIISNQDIYKRERLTGLVSAAFEVCIPVFKYGTSTVDDQTMLGELHLRPSYDGKDVLVSNFGRIDPEISQLQSVVEGNYRMILN